jgi:hypothetical protein
MAAVMMEVSRSANPPPGHLERVRQLCTANGADQPSAVGSFMSTDLHRHALNRTYNRIYYLCTHADGAVGTSV